MGIIDKFSQVIFWDTDPQSIDMERNAPYVVQRVLECGNKSDWCALREYYGLTRIAEVAQGLRSLEPKALAFISAISNKPKETFRCYTFRQSVRTHWVC